MSKDSTDELDEILNTYKRWIIESAMPANSFNKATIEGFDAKAKQAIQAHYAKAVLEARLEEVRHVKCILSLDGQLNDIASTVRSAANNRIAELQQQLKEQSSV